MAAKDYSGDAALAEARREAGRRRRRLLHDEPGGARVAFRSAEGDARLRPTGSGSRGRRRRRSSRPTSRSRPSRRSASRPGSSTTRAARSTSAGRRSGSSTGSTTGRARRTRRAPAASAGRRGGSDPDRGRAARPGASVSSWKRTMSTTGWRVGTSVDVAAEDLERCDGVARALRGAPLALEHEAADVLVDRGEMAVQELLGQVRLGGDVRAFAQLQRRLLRGRPVAAGAGDQPALVRRDGEPLARELCRNRVRQPGDVLAAQRGERGDRAGVARRVAVALLEPRACRRRPRRTAPRAGSRRLPGDEPLRARRRRAPPRRSAASRPRG